MCSYGIKKNEIILFENQGIKLDVNLKDEEELIEKETMTKFGNSEFADKPTNYYNLDMNTNATKNIYL